MWQSITQEKGNPRDQKPRGKPHGPVNQLLLMDSGWVFTHPRHPQGTTFLLDGVCTVQRVASFPGFSCQWRGWLETGFFFLCVCFSLLKHSNCFFLWARKYFLSFCCMVSLSSRRRGAGNQSRMFLRGTGGRVGEGSFFLHSMLFESNAKKYENQGLLGRELPAR